VPGMLLTAAVVAGAGAWGIVRAADERVADVDRVEGLESVLAPLPGGDGAPVSAVDMDGDGIPDPITYPAINFLLVGSDSREGVSEGDEDFAIVGDTSEVGGRRSDTIMILRQEENGGLALTSIPRDLWVEIAGTGRSQRINSAYNEGPERLAQTVTQALGIPIHHYVEVDFIGFKDIIDELGGVEVCVGNAARDTHSGLKLDVGCQTLDGVMALAYARSRYYQEWDGSQWVTDPRADLGRIERQQLFMRAAVDGALRELRSSPFGSGDLIEAVAGSVRIDERLDPYDAARTLRAAAEGDGIRTYRIPVHPETISGNAVLELDSSARDVLDYFRGIGPAPVEYETT
jgi:LCP family protein required for cell wall assembly